MGIIVQEQTGLFHLQSSGMSYIIQVVDGFPVHVYWGDRLKHRESTADLLPHTSATAGLDRLPQEYPQYGSGDFRTPAYQVELEDGTRITELKYDGYRIMKGKPSLSGLPAVYTENEDEADTLELELKDAFSGLKVVLLYTVFADRNVIARSARLSNAGEKNLRLLRALSASVDFSGKSDLEFMYLSGAWAREGNITRKPILQGETRIDSKRGMSSHQLNPFTALVTRETTESYGEAFGFSLVYSGGFEAGAEMDSFGSTRFNIGVNSFDFSWLLSPGGVSKRQKPLWFTPVKAWEICRGRIIACIGLDFAEGNIGTKKDLFWSTTGKLPILTSMQISWYRSRKRGLS